MADTIGNRFLSVTPSGEILASEKPMQDAVSIALHNIRSISEQEAKQPPSLRGDRVVISLQDPSSKKWVQGEMKVSLLASLIGFSEDEVIVSTHNGNIEEDLKWALPLVVPKEEKSHPEVKTKEGISIQFIGDVSRREVTLQDLEKEEPSSPAFEERIPQDVKEKIGKNLIVLGLTQAEFNEIDSFYKENYDSLLTYPKPGPIFIRRDSLDPPLPRSLVYIPDGPKKGLYILLKSHGGVEEKGVGGFNTATLAICVDTGKNAIWRTGEALYVEANEIEANQMASDRPEYFVAGKPVFYQGPFKPRRARSKAERASLPRKTEINPESGIATENIKKVGFIMDYMEGGDLFTRLVNGPPLTFKEKVQIGRMYAEALACLHDELGLVHFDQKLENVFLTSDGKPMIADFGFCLKVGQVGDMQGTPGYMAPELLVTYALRKEYIVHPAADIWSLGCVLSALFDGGDWVMNMGTAVNDPIQAQSVDLDPSDYQERNKTWFPDYKDPDHPHHIIYRCLSWDPKDRPEAKTVAMYLDSIESSLS